MRARRQVACSVYLLYHLKHLWSNATSGLVLAQISDPGNMGTLIRSGAAMGCSTVVIVEGTDPWGPKAVQASGGAIGKVHIIQTDWHELVTS